MTKVKRIRLKEVEGSLLATYEDKKLSFVPRGEINIVVACPFRGLIGCTFSSSLTKGTLIYGDMRKEVSKPMIRKIEDDEDLPKPLLQYPVRQVLNMVYYHLTGNLI